ncbi:MULTISPECIES: recombinase family protein [unclassified Bradyrhizobium]|nr:MULTISPECIES: recombinase family protein [unclassified Bradyrhizobium]
MATRLSPARTESGQSWRPKAEIVRRIFQDYVNGRTPRDIAHDLNGEQVPPPRGRSWNASTINGNRMRCSGILQNELYVGASRLEQGAYGEGSGHWQAPLPTKPKRAIGEPSRCHTLPS